MWVLTGPLHSEHCRKSRLYKIFSSTRSTVLPTQVKPIRPVIYILSFFIFFRSFKYIILNTIKMFVNNRNLSFWMIRLPNIVLSIKKIKLFLKFRASDLVNEIKYWIFITIKLISIYSTIRSCVYVGIIKIIDS